MKVMFMGTPDFSVYSLKLMVEEGYDVTSVVTQPDKKKGRGHKMAHPPVFDYAFEKKIEIYQPENLKKENFEEILIKENPDIIVVAAYGKILPEYVLNYPKYGCINVHASLLPKYRGAAPIQRCIIDGEEKTGVTIMYMEKGLDTGDMILKKEVEITRDDNYETLHDKLANIGTIALKEALMLIESGNFTREKQNDELSNYAPMIDKETAKIYWDKSAEDIFNLVRGLYPYPKSYTTYDGKLFKICKANVTDRKSNGKIGEITNVYKDSFDVACSDFNLNITKIQTEGKKEMDVSDYLKGNTIEKGKILGL
ncbi:MAG: methionyl-tRNA formyltransferase [Ruminococcaceae bacterium]|nr:methionyl-tRNA formyltransferase [Oscillospiraceae bacterium]